MAGLLPVRLSDCVAGFILLGSVIKSEVRLSVRRCSFIETLLFDYRNAERDGERAGEGFAGCLEEACGDREGLIGSF